jgi:phage shock protein PspC (stress-responsive transcriptional regulator)
VSEDPDQRVGRFALLIAILFALSALFYLVAWLAMP